MSLITHCKRHNHVLPENAKMKKQKKTITSDQTSSSQTTPTTTNSNANNHHTLSISNLASLNLNHQLSLQPRTDSIIDHSVDGTNYLNSNFLLGLSNRSLLNLQSATANNFNVK